MSDASPTACCEHCRETGTLMPAAERILRCGACGFLLPRSRVVAGAQRRALGGHMAIVAPGGVLRGKYRLIERLGEGPHGVTYLAEHEYLSHPCVVKVLPYRVGDTTDTAVLRLRQEARAGYSVHDPNVVRVLDCDVVRGVWYFVMEYVDGADLLALSAYKLRMSWQQAVRVGLDAAQGLAAIHRAGLVHRDIKPGNLIMGTDGRVRVADLGVAALAREQRDRNERPVTTLAGTLGYIAPEMFVSGVPVGPSADLYALGATLYHLLTGRLPHGGTQVFQRLIDLQFRPPAWPDDAVGDVPDWLRKVILRLLAIEPNERFDSTQALIEQLKSPVEHPVAPRPVFQPDALQPRGIGVLPFENEGGAAGDDWLGYAVAIYLSRALAKTPGVYVADQDGLVTMVGRLEDDGVKERGARLLEAGRMVGAGTVITGHFRREGSTVGVVAEAFRAGVLGPRPVARAEGALADLAKVESALLERLARVLGLEATVREPPRAPGGPPLLAAREKFVLGRQAFRRGDYEGAIALAQEAVRLDPQYAEAIGFAGVCYARLGRYEEAEAQHRQEEGLALEWGDPRLQTEVLANLGVMNYFRGDYEAAEAHYARALRMAEEVGLATERAQICNNLGFVLIRRGRPTEAEQAFLRVIETHRAYGGLTSLVGPYNGMGNVLVEQQRYGEARAYYRRALALASETGDRTSVGTTHMHLGRCAALQGRFADAKAEFTMALNALEETRFWNGLARAYEYIGEMNLQLGHFEEAIRCADKRIELARQHANLRMERAAWAQKAEALTRAGRAADAAACLVQARSDEDVRADTSG